jgi:hypothetical protein
MVRSRVADGGAASGNGGVAANTLNKQPQTNKGGPPAWGLGVGQTTLHLKKISFLLKLQELRTWTDSLDK